MYHKVSVTLTYRSSFTEMLIPTIYIYIYIINSHLRDFQFIWFSHLCIQMLRTAESAEQTADVFLPGRGALKAFHILQQDEVGPLAQPGHTPSCVRWEGRTRGQKSRKQTYPCFKSGTMTSTSLSTQSPQTTIMIMSAVDMH